MSILNDLVKIRCKKINYNNVIFNIKFSFLYTLDAAYKTHFGTSTK